MTASTDGDERPSNRKRSQTEDGRDDLKRSRTLPSPNVPSTGPILELRGGRGGTKPRKTTAARNAEGPQRLQPEDRPQRQAPAGLGDSEEPASTRRPKKSVPAATRGGRATSTRRVRFDLAPTDLGPASALVDDDTDDLSLLYDGYGDTDLNFNLEVALEELRKKEQNQDFAPLPESWALPIDQLARRSNFAQPSTLPRQETRQTQTGLSTRQSTTLGTNPQINDHVDSPYAEDVEITEGWHRLEQIIKKFVDTVLVQELPESAIGEDKYPYEVLRPLSSLPAEMSRSPRYAKYLFEISIWNMLNKKFFARAATAWAGEKPGALKDKTSRTRGLVAALAQLTEAFGVENEPARTHEERLEFFRWRNNSVTFISATANDQDAWEAVVDEVVCGILYTFAGHFKSKFSNGTAQDWDVLVARTSFLVAEAGALAGRMRQSRDGVWVPFIPTADRGLDVNAVEVHDQKDLALPPGQADVSAARSRITMTVVPGLAKFTTREGAAGSISSQDPVEPLPAILHKVRRKAKCFIDLTADDVTAGRQATGSSPARAKTVRP